jgi:hypothetical protein
MFSVNEGERNKRIAREKGIDDRQTETAAQQEDSCRQTDGKYIAI